MKNKIQSFVLIFVIFISFSISVFGEGNPNADGGGGGMGSGTNSNSWTPGNDGIRLSIVDAQTGVTLGVPIDYSKKNPSQNIVHFGKKSKIDYKNGSSLTLHVGGYISNIPVGNMPTIISSSPGNLNIAAIKRYFCSDGAARMIANDFGISFETLTSGKYKLLIEPIAYFKFNGQQVGMTAHEAALYDLQLSGGLRRKMLSLSHQNLPLAIFLERPDTDLGFPAYTGSTSKAQSNATIISSLGMGIVSYQDEPLQDPVPGEADVEYRVNTEVITSVMLSTNSEINPDSPATVTFRVGGKTYRMSDIVIPQGESQVVWCKWTTPPVEQYVTITISTNKGYLSENVIHAKIVDLEKKEPPDPKATDRNDGFIPPPVPYRPGNTYASWYVWHAHLFEYWVWEYNWQWDDANGDWVDRGRWVDKSWYYFIPYGESALLFAASYITPDDKSPTASYYSMRSGYGLNSEVIVCLSFAADENHFTRPQTVASYFPEFNYDTYCRLHDLTKKNEPYCDSLTFQFKKNKYSTYNQRTHFTPLWYPDGQYTVYTSVFDMWTPAGMMSIDVSNYISLKGSVYDDWRITPKAYLQN